MKIIRELVGWFKPEGTGAQQWKSWVGHSLVALLIFFVLWLLLAVPESYAAAIAVTMYTGRELLSLLDEVVAGKLDIDYVDHYMDAFVPLIVVLSVAGLLGAL